MTTASRVPACMDADELALWQAGNGVATGTKDGRRVYTGRAGSPCDDCTLGYAADMRAEGRCDGTPGGVEEDEMEIPATYSSGPTRLRTRVTVVAPCATCVHARVCRLRPADELVVSAELPELDAALTATLSATVECMEYARAKGVPAAGGPKKRAYSPEALERLRAGARKASEAGKTAREATA